MNIRLKNNFFIVLILPLLFSGCGDPSLELLNSPIYVDKGNDFFELKRNTAPQLHVAKMAKDLVGNVETEEEKISEIEENKEKIRKILEMDVASYEVAKYQNEIKELEKKIKKLEKKREKSIKQNKSKTVIISTFVDSNNLDVTNKLGRLLSEELISKMHKYGFNIIEFRATKELHIMKQKGSFAISREISKLRSSYGANYAVIGTYSNAASSVLINARMIDLETAEIQSVSSYEITKTKEIKYLLNQDVMLMENEQNQRKNKPISTNVYER
ncbi:MAG: hypothetical protein HQK84_00475 [Nitrospinae bacterium]|nr:hypothetical protein [Nitrospinota bacterium]